MTIWVSSVSRSSQQSRDPGRVSKASQKVARHSGCHLWASQVARRMEPAPEELHWADACALSIASPAGNTPRGRHHDEGGEKGEGCIGS